MLVNTPTEYETNKSLNLSINASNDRSIHLTSLPWDNIFVCYEICIHNILQLPAVDVTALGRVMTGYTMT